MSRDDQFKQWAKAVFEELISTQSVYIDTMRDDWREEWQEVIACAAYDLVKYTLEYVFAHPDIDDCLSHPNNEPITLIPDMAELPEENNTSTD